MSRWVDMDNCPCRGCKDMAQCDNKATPWCERYAEWYAGADVVPVEKLKDYIKRYFKGCIDDNVSVFDPVDLSHDIVGIIELTLFAERGISINEDD